ncbi:MAG: hypothetical protein KBS61_02580 [Chryseobacterium sp.]|nr:hypothetical protein [Candidatus Chryseobacterium enterohippi]
MDLKELFELKEDFNPSNQINKISVNTLIKHLGIRFGALFAVWGLLFLGFYIEDSSEGTLLAFLLSIVALIIWILYLLIETIVLFSTPKKSLAIANLIVAGSILFVSAIFVLDNL